MTRGAVIGLAIAVMALVACDGDDETASPATSTLASSPVSDVVSTAPDDEAPDDDAANETSPVTTTAGPSAISTPSVHTPPTTVSDEGVSDDGVSDEGVSDEGVSLGALGDTQVNITTEDGAVQIGSGTVPAVAADVPVPDDFEVQLSSVSGASAGFTGTSGASIDDVAEFYRDQLPVSGFTIDEDRDLGSAVMVRFSRNDESGQIAISDTPGGTGTTIVVAFGPA